MSPGSSLPELETEKPKNTLSRSQNPLSGGLTLSSAQIIDI
jgi:hypothetical protein